MTRQDAPPVTTSAPARPQLEGNDKKVYTPPEIAILGSVRELTLGSAHQDTADMDKARYN